MPTRPPHRPPAAPARRSLALRCSILALALGMATLLALLTPLGSGPDEAGHIAAVHYFQDHLWPPDGDVARLEFSAYGTSRALNGEWIYWVMGRASAAAEAVLPSRSIPRLLRLANVAALAALLAPLLFWPSRLFRLDLCGAFVATVPQILYLASYVNDDLWSIAAATWMLRSALAVFEDDRAAHRLLFGVALGLTLGAKPSAWVMVPCALALALARRGAGGWWRHWRAALGAVLLLLAPLRIAYPLLRQVDVRALRSAHAREGLDPRHPSAPGFELRKQGVGWGRAVLFRPDWWKRTAASSYAFFGSMAIFPPALCFLLAAAAWLGLLGVDLAALARPGSDRRVQRAITLGAALALAALVAASAFHSWNSDYQPQGRYLLPAILPLAVLLCGIESPHRHWQRALLVALGALAVVSLAATLPRLA